VYNSSFVWLQSCVMYHCWYSEIRFKSPVAPTAVAIDSSHSTVLESIDVDVSLQECSDVRLGFKLSLPLKKIALRVQGHRPDRCLSQNFFCRAPNSGRRTTFFSRHVESMSPILSAILLLHKASERTLRIPSQTRYPQTTSHSP
jgi:hypothetical protein